ncbi:cation:proton antiporter [Nitratifractor sp.]
MSYESIILILFVIASIVAVTARRYNLPYTIALVAVGLILGGLHLIHPPRLSQELLYDIFLPPLIFQTAIHLKLEDLQRDAWPITFLVVPGVVLSTLATAAVMIPASHLFAHIDTITWPLGILFGAAVAATDPIAVIAIFERLGAPRRLQLLIDSESLLNDGTSIVVFILAMQYLQGSLGSVQFALIDFVRIVGLGLLVGTVVGLLTDTLMRNLDDAMIVITVTTVAAYGSFLLADRLGVSGVMSTVAAGLVVGQRSFGNPVFPTIRLTTETFWEYMAFAMNSLIFLLMGFTINLTMLWELWPIVLIAYLSVLAARFFVVYGTWALFHPTRYRFPASWAAVLGWGGLRGALSMVLALSLPESFAMKDVIVTLVFGVVLLSIFIQGLTMSPLMRLLGLVSPVSELKSYEALKARIALLQDSLESIDRKEKRHTLGHQSAEALRREIQQELDELTKELEATAPDAETRAKEELLRTKRRILNEQKQELLEMYHNGAISHDAYESLRNEIDMKIFELENLGA